MTEHEPWDVVKASDIPLPPLHAQIAAGVVEMTVYIDPVAGEPAITHRQRKVLRERIEAALLQYAEAVLKVRREGEG